MSEEQLKAFLEKVKGDTSLQEKLKAAGDANAVVSIAKAAGFVISLEELQKAQTEISEEELEGMAGGVNWPSLAGGTIGCVLIRDVNSGLCNMPWKKIF
jgi:predicted ribosomally synthesized peptide with nif11-like leader